jgi:RNA polymerase sigma factor (sigma-70 family)
MPNTKEVDLADHYNLIPFVIHSKMRWLLDFYPMEDLLSEGCVALVKAKSTYKAEQGFKFTTYSTKCIFQYLMDWHRKESKVKGYNLYSYKRKRPVKERIEDVDMDKLIPTLTPVRSYQLRRKYKIGTS